MLALRCVHDESHLPSRKNNLIPPAMSTAGKHVWNLDRPILIQFVAASEKI